MAYEKYFEITDIAKNLKIGKETIPSASVPVRIGRMLSVGIEGFTNGPIRGRLDGLYKRPFSSDIIFLKEEGKGYGSLTGRFDERKATFTIDDAVSIEYLD